MILITGGTGKTGRRLARRLIETGHPVRLASRSESGLEGAESIAFDWNDAASYDTALAKVNSVYMVAPVGATDPYSAMAAFLDRALTLGVQRFVLLSASSLPEGGPAMGQVHTLLRQTAPEWAVLRPTWFQQNFSEGAHQTTIRQEDRIYSATGDGRVPFVDANDIAEVGFRALVDQTPHNTDHVITGPEALTYGEAAMILSKATGQPIQHINLTEAQLAERWTAFGLETEYAVLLARMDTAIAQGGENRTTDTVLRITERPPRSFAEFAHSAVAAWK